MTACGYSVAQINARLTSLGEKRRILAVGPSMPAWSSQYASRAGWPSPVKTASRDPRYFAVRVTDANARTPLMALLGLTLFRRDYPGWAADGWNARLFINGDGSVMSLTL